jgi:hypothetical protein
MNGELALRHLSRYVDLGQTGSKLAELASAPAKCSLHAVGVGSGTLQPAGEQPARLRISLHARCVPGVPSLVAGMR